MTQTEFHFAIKKLAKGDKQMLRAIYEAYGKLIYAVVYDLLKSREDAEDVTSEFFIKLIHVAGSYKKDHSHKAWLVQIAKNMAIDWMRKRGREVLLYEDAETGEVRQDVLETGKTEQTQDSVEEKTVLAADLKQAMEALSKKEQEVIDMKLLGDMKFREIAEATGQPMGTVTWLYNQGILKLRRCLKEYGTTGE